MTIKVMEGFDLIGTGSDLIQRGAQHGEGTVQTTASKWSTPVLDLGSGSSTVLTYTLAGNDTEEYVCLSFWRWINVLPTSTAGHIVSIHNLANAVNDPAVSQMHVGLVTSATPGLLNLYMNGVFSGTTLPNALVALAWQHFELRVRVHETLGTVEFWIDGIKLLDLTSQDTLDSALATMRVTFTGIAGAVDSLIDDVAIQQGSSIQPTLGHHRIHTQLPDGNGTNTAWTGTFTDVDDPFGASDGDSTFANATTLNDKQDYSIEDLAVTPTTIHAVSLTSEMRKDDTGTKGATPYILSNSVEDTGTEHGTAESYTQRVDIFELDPDGSVAWDEAAVNALLIGHEITTT